MPPYQLITTEAQLAPLFAALDRVDEIALDTEADNLYRYRTAVCLLQIQADREIYLVDLLAGLPLGELWPRLAAKHLVMHGSDYDLRLLRGLCAFQPRSLFDTMFAAQLLNIPRFGLAALLEQFFGIKLDKKHQRADWSMRPLTADMLDYAAQDTMHLLGLRDLLHAELVKKGRLAWAQEEFERLEKVRWPADDSANGFLKVKGARDLTRRELAVFRELVQWRDAAALKLDRATFRVVSNEVLLDAAKSHPASKDALGQLKGMPRGILERNGQEILAAIDRGLAVPEAELPKFAKAPRWDRDPEFDHKVGALKAVRDAAATRLELDPGVLCSRERMETVARLLPGAPDELTQIPEFRRWQIAELGDGFVRALAPWRKKDSPYLEK